MKILDDYNQALKSIYEYFECKEKDFFPIRDCREYFWTINGELVYFDKDKHEFLYDKKSDRYYCIFNEESDSYELYHEGNPSINIYARNEYTAILISANSCSEKFLAICDNSKMVNLK